MLHSSGHDDVPASQHEKKKSLKANKFLLKIHHFPTTPWVGRIFPTQLVGASWRFLRFETPLGHQLIEVGHSHTDAHLHRNQLDGLLRICPRKYSLPCIIYIHTLCVYVYFPRPSVWVSNFSPGLFLEVKGIKIQTLGGFR